MLRIVLLLLAMVAMLPCLLGASRVLGNMVIVLLARTWLGLHLVIIRLVGSTPPWAHRSLLNYVKAISARYAHIKRIYANTRMTIRISCPNHIRYAQP